MKTLRLFVCCLAVGWAPGATLAQGLERDFRVLQSRLLSMAEGYYTAAEWSAVFADLEQVTQRARDERNTPLVIDASLLRAMAHADMRQEYEQARVVLEDARRRYADSGAPNVKKIYGRLAEVYAQLGDQAAIDRLIREYESSPAYDSAFYKATFSPGGPHSQITIARPSAAVSDSITVTSMERYRTSASYGVGSMFPDDLVGIDGRGQTVRFSSYRGKVVLVDFWVSGWHPWVRDLPYMKRTYERYHGQGFEVLGVSLDRNAETARQAIRRHKLPWNSIIGEPSLGATFGIFGEASNFLVGRDGEILARNIRVSELGAVLGRSL